MITIISIVIFIIVLFFYLHLQNEYKINNDLEVLSVNLQDKNNFEEICNLKQPVLFNYYLNNKNILTKENLLNNYKIFDISIRNIKNKENEELFINLNLEKSFDLFNKDKKKSYITENNYEFIKEVNFTNNFSKLNNILKPYLCLEERYDLMTGSKNSYTPLRYNLSNRNFYYVSKGNIEVKLVPPKYSIYLNEIKDYENFEFRSSIDIWNSKKKDNITLEKLKQLNFILSENNILYIPKYWWYSFKYIDSTIVYNAKYKTIINQISNLKHSILYFLQNQNIEKKEINIFKSNNMNDNIISCKK